MKKWKELSNTEKTMIGMIAILLLMVALNWSKVSEGIKGGYAPKKEIPTNNNN